MLAHWARSDGVPNNQSRRVEVLGSHLLVGVVVSVGIWGFGTEITVAVVVAL